MSHVTLAQHHEGHTPGVACRREECSGWAEISKTDEDGLPYEWAVSGAAVQRPKRERTAQHSFVELSRVALSLSDLPDAWSPGS